MAKLDIDAGYHGELIDDLAFIAPNAVVRGQVTLEAHSSVWFGAIVRGDTEVVRIGSRTNVQDLSVLHADPGVPCLIGAGVTIGHAAVVHGAAVGDGALIGIRSVVLNGATIGAEAIIGAGAVVTEGTEIPPGHLAVGVPARVVRELTDEDRLRCRRTAEHYVQASRAYAAIRSSDSGSKSEN
ncbi:MAG: gamma carbonic anhydrase family protein [Planctomycetota bacterium]